MYLFVIFVLSDFCQTTVSLITKNMHANSWHFEKHNMKIWEKNLHNLIINNYSYFGIFSSMYKNVSMLMYILSPLQFISYHICSIISYDELTLYISHFFNENEISCTHCFVTCFYFAKHGDHLVFYKCFIIKNHFLIW